MPDLSTLKSRVSALKGGDREVDGALWLQLETDVAQERCGFRGRRYAGRDYSKAEKAEHIANMATSLSPPFTSSVDAALALIERCGRDPMDFMDSALADMASSGWDPNVPIAPQFAKYLIIALLEALDAPAAPTGAEPRHANLSAEGRSEVDEVKPSRPTEQHQPEDSNNAQP